MKVLNQLTLTLIILLTASITTLSLAKDQSPEVPDATTQKRLKDALKEDRETLLKVAEELLSPLEFEVAFKSGTERAFRNRYYDNKEAGIYVDVVSGEPLFSSAHKFKSGTGWPSFDRSLSDTEVLEVEDTSHGMKRVEVRSKMSDIHLGHVFEDGPKSTTGRRFCINSASLRFVPLSEIKSEGYLEVLRVADLLEEYKGFLEGNSENLEEKSAKKVAKKVIKRAVKKSAQTAQE